MQLIYRAQFFDYTSTPQPYRKPRALNWRFQAPGEVYEETTALLSLYKKPRAMNWRYELAVKA